METSVTEMKNQTMDLEYAKPQQIHTADPTRLKTEFVQQKSKRKRLERSTEKTKGWKLKKRT